MGQEVQRDNNSQTLNQKYYNPDYKMTWSEYSQYMAESRNYNAITQNAYRDYLNQRNSTIVSRDGLANEIAHSAQIAGGVVFGASALVLGQESFDTEEMKNVYNKLVNEINNFCDINECCNELMREAFSAGGVEAALVGLSGATATKSWSDNMGAMSDLESALSAYAASELAIAKENAEVDSSMRDSFSKISMDQGLR